jgi:hypothetical protein
MSLTLSDIFLLIAAAEVLAIMVCFTKEYQMGVMSESVPDMTPEVRKVRNEQFSQVPSCNKWYSYNFQYSFATVLLYDTSLYFLKFSILAFYFKLFPVTSIKLRNGLFVVTTYTVACSLAAFFMALFWCGFDVSINWKANQHHKCTFWSLGLFTADWVLNITSDILILGLPFPLLSKLKLARRQIIALCLTFGLGVVTMVVSIGRFVTFMETAFVPLCKF